MADERPPLQHERDPRLHGLPLWVTVAHLDKLPEGAKSITARMGGDGTPYVHAEYSDGSTHEVRPGDVRPEGETPAAETPAETPVEHVEPAVETPDLEDTPVDHTQTP